MRKRVTLALGILLPAWAIAQVGGNGPRSISIRGHIGERIQTCVERRVKAQDTDELVEPFRHLTEVSDLFVIKELVKEGCGITFLYRKAVERELADGSILQVELADFQVSHEFTFLWRKNSVFEEEFRQVFRELSGK